MRISMNKGIHTRWERFLKMNQKSTIPSCLVAETLCTIGSLYNIGNNINHPGNIVLPQQPGIQYVGGGLYPRSVGSVGSVASVASVGSVGSSIGRGINIGNIGDVENVGIYKYSVDSSVVNDDGIDIKTYASQQKEKVQVIVENVDIDRNAATGYSSSSD